MQEETLDFSVTLTGTFWDKRPQYSIWLDDKVITQSEIQSGDNVVKFARNLTEGNHCLKIRLDNKTSDDTVVENGSITKDMLLNINDITIDSISLGNLMWESEYLLDSPQIYNGKEITKLDRCVNLGWNGTYVMNFTSPFYLWLLEKL